jgi:proline dehydrogenase
MARRIWQAVMIQLARFNRLKQFMQTNRATSMLARQYVGGDCALAAINTAISLSQKGVTSSLFYLGEYVDTQEKIVENTNAKMTIAPLLAKRNLDIHISVDPTQVGGTLDWQQGVDNIRAIAKLVDDLPRTVHGVHCVMLDMEDYSVNGKTLALHDDLLQQGLPIAITLQAYLRKTVKDMEQKVRQGAKVRLVKGAFAAGPELAFQRQSDINKNYQTLIDLMLGETAKAAGFYPIFATHDDTLHDYVIECARKNGWNKGDYEFEMLYGARNDLAEQLASQGERIRLYLPFGKDWWPYAIRRIGENPRSVQLLMKSLR